ncbi:hypothetical protein ES708_17036 [subsurface metagenome]
MGNYRSTAMTRIRAARTGVASVVRGKFSGRRRRRGVSAAVSGADKKGGRRWWPAAQPREQAKTGGWVRRSARTKRGRRRAFVVVNLHKPYVV